MKKYIKKKIDIKEFIEMYKILFIINITAFAVIYLIALLSSPLYIIRHTGVFLEVSLIMSIVNSSIISYGLSKK